MKENVLDVLMYLFENYYAMGAAEEPLDHDLLTSELQRAGFRNGEITKAFAWLESLVPTEGARAPAGRSIRVYTSKECAHLDTQCRGFLMFLEQSGVLDPTSRELVIDRVMALDSEDMDLTQIKWVILMVLFNQPDKEGALAWIEDLVFEGTDIPRH